MDSMIIPLNAEVVSAPNAYHLGVLFAHMVSPDDQQLRLRVMHSSAVQHGLDLMAEGRLTRSQIKKLAVEAYGATSPPDLQQVWEDRARKGYAAGMMLWNSCKARILGEDAPLGNAKKKIGSALFQRGENNSHHVDDKVWKIYKPSIALWATFIQFEEMEPDELPCSRTFLPNWLAFFDAFRHMAETTKTHDKGRSFLEGNDSFRLTPELVRLLPPGKLIVGPSAPRV